MSHHNIASNFMDLIRMMEKYAPYAMKLYAYIQKPFKFLFNCFLWILAYMEHRPKSQPNEAPIQPAEEQNQTLPAIKKNEEADDLTALAIPLLTPLYFLCSFLAFSAFSDNPRKTFFSLVGGTFFMIAMLFLGELSHSLMPALKKKEETNKNTVLPKHSGENRTEEVQTAQQRSLITAQPKIKITSKPKTSVAIPSAAIAAVAIIGLCASARVTGGNVSVISRLISVVDGFFACTYMCSAITMFRQPPAQDANAYGQRATR